MTDLQYFLDEQSNLQQVMEDNNGSPHPTRLFLNFANAEALGRDTSAEAEGIIKMMQWNDKALLHELVEMESETGWKPWAKGAFVNLEAARGEWIDMLHFMLNGALLLGLNEEEIKKRYDAKHKKNATRQEEGYDGVTTKCPGCKRALDDEAVKCIVEPDQNRYFCETKGVWALIA